MTWATVEPSGATYTNSLASLEDAPWDESSLSLDVVPKCARRLGASCCQASRLGARETAHRARRAALSCMAAA